MSALTGGQDRDRAVASAASPCAVSTRMHAGKQHLRQYHKDHFRKLGKDFGDKHEEMDLHFFSCGLACSMFTAFVVCFCGGLEGFEV